MRRKTGELWAMLAYRWAVLEPSACCFAILRQMGAKTQLPRLNGFFVDWYKILHTHIPDLPEHGSQRVVREQEPVRVRQPQHLSLDHREAQVDRFLGPAAHGPLVF